MQEIRDLQKLETYLERFHIRELFDTRDLPFRLYRYEVGEMLNILRPTRDYLKFVLEGSFDLYSIREDGGRHLVWHCEGFTFLGDLEFCGKTAGMRYQEVTRTVYSIELPLEVLRPTLQKDVRFLNFLLDTMSIKFAGTSMDLVGFSDLQERLLYHIRYECPDQTITSVSQTAFRLNYSLRQTQRVLQELTREGILKRKRKGHYALTEG
ncbi:MAG: hypothetical protein IJN67_09110 [Oscillospiraceae bacterium]|nr:hypothetical protein [Oscillospiraceae bacterium]